MSDVTVTTRPAATADAEDVARLLRVLGAHGEVDAAEALCRIERGIEDVIVACVDGQVGGLVAIKKVLYFGHAEPQAHISALVTDPGKRRAGLAAALVQASRHWAVGHGCIGLELMCGIGPAREAAHSFYPAVGFDRTAYVYSMNLVT